MCRYVKNFQYLKYNPILTLLEFIQKHRPSFKESILRTVITQMCAENSTRVVVSMVVEYLVEVPTKVVGETLTVVVDKLLQ